MDHNVSPLQRAFELARSGDYSTIDSIRRRLRDEGYSTAQLSGPTLLRQLRALMQAARQPQ